MPPDNSSGDNGPHGIDAATNRHPRLGELPPSLTDGAVASRTRTEPIEPTRLPQRAAELLKQGYRLALVAAHHDTATFSSAKGVTIEGTEAAMPLLIVKDPPEHSWAKGLVVKMFSRSRTPVRLAKLIRKVTRVLNASSRLSSAALAMPSSLFRIDLAKSCMPD